MTHYLPRTSTLNPTRPDPTRPGTMQQAVATCGSRRARYRGLAKTRLEHTFSATALNMLRLEGFWNGPPLDRSRTSHLARLCVGHAA